VTPLSERGLAPGLGAVSRGLFFAGQGQWSDKWFLLQATERFLLVSLHHHHHLLLLLLMSAVLATVVDYLATTRSALVRGTGKAEGK
jgi:hypothetical protein